MSFAEAVIETTVVRCARPELSWINITRLGDDRPVLLEQWRGWKVELWCDWDRCFA